MKHINKAKDLYPYVVKYYILLICVSYVFYMHDIHVQTILTYKKIDATITIA
jgi:hypothetical protein